MSILDYIEKIKRENEGPRITTQEPRIGLAGGGFLWKLLYKGKSGLQEGSIARKLKEEYIKKGMDKWEALRKSGIDASDIVKQKKLKIVQDQMAKTNYSDDTFVDLIDEYYKLTDYEMYKDIKRWDQTRPALADKTRAIVFPEWAETRYGDDYHTVLERGQTREIQQSIDPNIKEPLSPADQMASNIDEMNKANIAELFEGKKKHAIGGRVGYNDGQLVTPSVDGSRPGYQGPKKKGKIFTIKEAKKINSELPDNITLKKNELGNWNYHLSKDVPGKRIRISRAATDEGLDFLKNELTSINKKHFPNMLSPEKFEELRFLDENINLTEKEFAKKLNQSKYTTPDWNRPWSWQQVQHWQKKTGINNIIPKQRTWTKRTINEAKALIRKSIGGQDILKDLNQMKPGPLKDAAIRKEASRIFHMQNKMAAYGGNTFAAEKTLEAKAFNNMFEAHKQNSNIKIGGEFNGKDLSKRKNWPRNDKGQIDWSIKGADGKTPAWKSVTFEMDTPKGNRTFSYQNLRTQVDDAYGSGFFARKTKPYVAQQVTSTPKIRQWLARSNIIKDYQAIPGNEGKTPSEKYIQKRMRIYSPAQVHHTKGIGTDLWDVQLTSRIANQKLGKAELTYKAALNKAGNDTTKIKAAKDNFIKSIEDISGKYGGIQYTVDGKIIGDRPSDISPYAAEGREAGLLKHKDFRSFLNSRLKDTYARNQAKLFEKMGIKINEICSSLAAGGGRIGFANKVCGMELVESNSDEFLRLSEQKMNEPFEFQGKKYNSFNEFAKTKPGLWKNLTRSAGKFARYAASPTTLLGGEVWYTVLDTMASMDKGIKFNEALDNALFFYDFGQGKKNMLAKGKELGWSDAQIQDATQVFDLAKNQMNIEKTEQKINTLGQWKEDKGFRHGEGMVSGQIPLRYTDIEGDIERTKIYLSNIQKKQDDTWSNYASGKTKAEMDKGFELPYKLGEELRREELISQRKEDKRKVYPYMSDVWNIFPSVWSPIDTIKEKYKLQGASGFLPGVDEELLAKARAKGASPWMFGMSDADLAEHNKKRQFRTVEELKEGPLMEHEMADISGRNKWLSYLYQPQADGGRAGYMGGGIAGIRRPHAIPPERQGLRSIMINANDD